MITRGLINEISFKLFEKKKSFPRTLTPQTQSFGMLFFYANFENYH